METYLINDFENVRNLVSCTHATDEPVIVFDGEDECLIAMRPQVFERILFDSDLLNCEKREAFHL